MQLLIGGQMQAVIYHAHIYRPQVVRTFGDYDGISFECPVRQVAQRAPRQQMVIDVQMVVRGQKDIQSATDSPMLQRIIQNDHI